MRLPSGSRRSRGSCSFDRRRAIDSSDDESIRDLDDAEAGSMVSTLHTGECNLFRSREGSDERTWEWAV
jgi:hypothetical protein